jgi:tetratricopeptide (TPR) repeat protein
LIETNLGPDHPDTLVVMTNLAGCYRELGKTELALPLVEKILKRRKELLGADHPDTLMSMNNLAAMYDSIGKPDLALPLIVESVELQRVKLGDDHPSTLVSMTNLAECYRRVKQLDRSVAIFEETLKTAKAKLGTDHPIVSKCTHGLAAAYWATKQFDKAIPMFEDLVKRSEAKLGRHHPETLILMANLGANYNDAGRIKEAISVLEEVNTFIDEYPRLRGFDLPLCEAYATAGESVKLATLRLKHLSEARAALPKESPQIGAILAQIGMGLLVEKKWAEAEPFLRECLAIREKTQPDVWSTFNTKSQLGGSLLGQHKYAESEPLLIAGYEGMKQREKTIQPVGRPRLPEALDRLIELYTATDRPDEVKKWQAERAKYPAAAPPPGEKK